MRTLRSDSVLIFPGKIKSVRSFRGCFSRLFLLVVRSLTGQNGENLGVNNKKTNSSKTDFRFIPSVIFALSLSHLHINSRNSDPGSHTAGSSPPSPLRFVPCLFIARRFQRFLPSSTRAELQQYQYRPELLDWWPCPNCNYCNGLRIMYQV